MEVLLTRNALDTIRDTIKTGINIIVDLISLAVLLIVFRAIVSIAH